MSADTPGLGPSGPADWARALSGSSFGAAAMILDGPARRDLALFYAYCRAVDDCADEFAPSEAAGHLRRWDAELRRIARGVPRSSLGLGLQDFCARRRVPPGLLRDLWLGARSDARVGVRFATFAALRRYCYRVAGSVGLACLPVFGVDLEAGRDYAVALGEAFQLINILRDVREDSARGRLYFALEDLRRHKVAPEALLSGGAQGAPALLRDYADRARKALARADAAAQGLPRRGLRPPRLMRAVYEALLEAMERDGFRVLEKRYSLGPLRKRLLVVKALLW